MLPLRRALPIALIALYGWMAWSVISRTGVTADETAHVTAGYTYWSARDFRLQPENGNFPQRWEALPLLGADLSPPATAGAAWTSADVWHLGHAFFFAQGNDPARILRLSRTMVVLLGLALVAAAWAWSRRLFGRHGGLLTLVLVVFCPHLLAHGALATSDLAATLGFLLALLTWWRLCHRCSAGRIAAAGLALGLLALAKYSALIFAPVGLLLVLVRLAHPAPLPGGRRRFAGARRIAPLLGSALAAVLIAYAVVWSAYGFRYAASPDGGDHFVKPWSEVLISQPHTAGSAMADGRPPADPVRIEPGIVQAFVRGARTVHLLPEAWLYGLAFTDLHARGRLAYFAGDYRETGWWQFFPVAFVLKTTLPALLMLVLAALAFARARPGRRRRWLYRLAPLLLFAAIYWAFAITSHLNIGHRHLLPLYPVMAIVVGIVAVSRTRWLRVAAVLLCLWHAAESWAVRPGYLTYFNELAGGPDGGHRYLVDSSLDWGQGLPALSGWLAAHRDGARVYLSSFGSDEPARFHLDATRIGDGYFDFTARPALPRLEAGLYCISATMLHRVYTAVRGPWSDDYEQAYERLAQAIVTDQLPPGDASARLETFDQLRFGRLCLYLQHRQPDAIVGHVFFVYRLSQAEVDTALAAPWRDIAARPAQASAP